MTSKLKTQLLVNHFNMYTYNVVLLHNILLNNTNKIKKNITRKIHVSYFSTVFYSVL